MPYLLVKHGVEDFDRWKAIVDEDKAAQEEYGIKIKWVMREIGNPNMVVFMLEVESVERANEFMARPESVEGGKRAGVTGDPLVMFLDEVNL